MMRANSPRPRCRGAFPLGRRGALLPALLTMCALYCAAESAPEDATRVGLGMLYVRCNVSARVSVDGLPVGETNRVLTDLPAGKTITVEVTDPSGRYEPARKEVVLAPDRITRVKVTLEKVRARLRITTEPPGAEVYVDDEAYPGRTPLELALDPGRYTVVVVKEGFQDVVLRGLDLRPPVAAARSRPPSGGPPGATGDRPAQPREVALRLVPGPSTYNPFLRLYRGPLRPQRMKLLFGADDQFVLYLNGKEIGRGSNWAQLFEYDVALKPGDVIAAEVTDVGGGAEGKCGFRSALAIGRYRREIGDAFRWSPLAVPGWPERPDLSQMAPVRPVPHELNTPGLRMYWGYGPRCFICWVVRY